MRQYVATAMKTVSEAWEQPWHLLSFSEKAIYACNLGDSRIYRQFSGEAPAEFPRTM